MQNNARHQHQLSVNSVQSLIEPTTPPSLGQMNNKRFHQKTQSLDLSNFNQFMSATANNQTNKFNNSSPLLYTNGVPSSFNMDGNFLGGSSQNSALYINNSSTNNSSSSTSQSTPISFNKGTNLPLINEFDVLHNTNYMPFPINAPLGINTNQLAPTNSNMNAILSNNGKHNNELSNNIVPLEYSNGVQNIQPQLLTTSHESSFKTKTLPMSKKSVNTDKPLANMNEINSRPLEELDFLSLSTDQYGCRFLQKKLEDKNINDSNKVRDLLFDQTRDHFLDLILDPFGNYLVQKLCYYLTTDQKTILIQAIYTNMYQISINQYGTRSLQKIIDVAEEDYQIDMIIDGFSNREYISTDQVVKIINDLNGNHVIQKCIFKFQPSKLNFLIDVINTGNNIVHISTHKHGCCVLQKLLGICKLQQTLKISMNIIEYLPKLINDQFGNYIVQFLLDTDELKFYFLPETYKKLSNNLPQLSCMKFSSNVIEKIIKILYVVITKSANCSNVIPNQDDLVPNVMEILISIIEIFTANLNVLIRDNYGNYTLQTLLDVKNYSTLLDYTPIDKMDPTSEKDSKSQAFEKFKRELSTKITHLIFLTKELLPSIKATSYAKKIKSKVKDFAEFKGVQISDLTSECNILPTDNQQISEVTKSKHTKHSSLPKNNHKKPFNKTQNRNSNNNSSYSYSKHHYNYTGNHNYDQKINQYTQNHYEAPAYDVNAISRPLSKLDLNLLQPMNENIYNSKDSMGYPESSYFNAYEKNNGFEKASSRFDTGINKAFIGNTNDITPNFNKVDFSSQQYPFN
ncbi:hypothetical protein TPHA_0D01040 [Tetrapisispora phaffii CBS 4417]|uniref:PUM-HD domain-containing protein n=1 Tax=Tetrapisispora phaffii (strain ATCC 24235 / CBS 4417 / NBRC 1672 / NRRL Y-8282 / UCD 70-5) TaxID=1071381 RepID=G8BSC4_TETPH|nr:hypothetical protein TPHA_0D01040 [Tetrapisispora phaffii CBS 4417]CCE62745.1 hypothetical protein TPHA_0D01040 [Tetrapisispora phaffii CBS 4417]